MAEALENAVNLYLRGIRDGGLDEVLTTYMGKSYTQHSTGVKDGKEGFRSFFEDFFRRNPDRDIRVVHSFQDGSFVFMHVFQSLNGGEAQWVTADIFRAGEDGRIVEHWDVIEEYHAPAADEPDQILGTFALDASSDSGENKAAVRRFLVEAMQNHDPDAFGTYVAEDVIQHDPDLGQGACAWKAWTETHEVDYGFVFKVVGAGNFVAAYSEVSIGGVPYAHVDLFRLEDGRIVEHWTTKEPMPPRSELANSGKF